MCLSILLVVQHQIVQFFWTRKSLKCVNNKSIIIIIILSIYYIYAKIKYVLIHRLFSVLWCTLSMADISPGDSPIDTSVPDRKHICILALDGGGVWGLSSLILLHGLMQRVAIAEGISSNGNVANWPSDFFNLIIGTGTGGISALFLGHLHMMVDEAITVYQDVANTAFQLPALVFGPLPCTLQHTPLSWNLEKCVGNIVQHYLGDHNAPLSDPPGGSCTCHTAVLVSTAASTDSLSHIFQSYFTSEPPSSFTVHEVAHAAVAIPGMSLEVSFGSPPMQFVCAGIVGYNNPAETKLLEAARNLDGCVIFLVSWAQAFRKLSTSAI